MKQKDIDLVRFFILSEAKDYSDGRGDYEWVNFRMNQILAAFIAKQAPTISLYSYGSIGEPLRMLELILKAEKDGNMEVRFCTCGKNHCWGTITNNGEEWSTKEQCWKPTGKGNKMGLMPLFD